MQKIDYLNMIRLIKKLELADDAVSHNIIGSLDLSIRCIIGRDI